MVGYGCLLSLAANCYLLTCCMVIFLHGEDDFLVGRRKRALVKAFQKKYVQAEVFVFDFEDQGTPEDIRRALSSCESGLFAAEKMVVFLHPFVLGEGAEKILVEFLKQQTKRVEEKNILLFVHGGKVKKTHPLTSALLKVVDTEEMIEVPKGKEAMFVRKELARLNPELTLHSHPLTLFLEATGNNTARMVSELEKLAAFKERGDITADDIRLLLEPPQGQVIFEALDALGRGDKKRALFLFHREVTKPGGAFPVLALCAWQVRRLLLVREAYDRGMRRPADVAQETKLAPFAVQKIFTSIEHFPLARIKQGIILLSDIDTQLKQGKADPLVALDMFVWKF